MASEALKQLEEEKQKIILAEYQVQIDALQIQVKKHKEDFYKKRNEALVRGEAFEKYKPDASVAYELAQLRRRAWYVKNKDGRKRQIREYNRKKKEEKE